MYPIIHFFGREIGTYSLCALIGFFVCVTFFYFKAKKIGLFFSNTIILFLAVAAGLLIGGHLLYGITNIKSIILVLRNLHKLTLVQFVSLMSNIFGGSVFYGGLFGSLVALKIYTRKTEPEKKEYITDLYAVCIPLFHTFGRIGCFFGGCCYGIEAPIGFKIEHNPIVPGIEGVTRFPVALLEAFCNLVIFAVLYFFLKHGRLKSKLIYLYGMTYSVIRFNLEFLRGDEVRGIVFGLSTSQWISIVLISVCLVYFMFFTKSEFTEKQLRQND